jgi:hypothetical protein
VNVFCSLSIGGRLLLFREKKDRSIIRCFFASSTLLWLPFSVCKIDILRVVLLVNVKYRTGNAR